MNDINLHISFVDEFFWEFAGASPFHKKKLKCFLKILVFPKEI